LKNRARKQAEITEDFRIIRLLTRAVPQYPVRKLPYSPKPVKVLL
jgi:hypothetical protein